MTLLAKFLVLLSWNERSKMIALIVDDEKLRQLRKYAAESGYVGRPEHHQQGLIVPRTVWKQKSPKKNWWNTFPPILDTPRRNISDLGIS